MNKEYLTISNTIEATFIAEKSKFISYIFPCDSKNDFEVKLNAIKKKHYKSTHICYAYVFANPSMQKSSDDGEPSGTAGIPILESIKKTNLENIAGIVVRYFGGIKLGTGGLIRAYGESIRIALSQSNIIEYRNRNIYMIEFNFNLLNYVENHLDLSNTTIIKKDENEKAMYTFYYNNDEYINDLIDCSQNEIKIINIENKLLQIKKSSQG